MTAASPAWLGRTLRIDPTALPVRFQVPGESGAGDASVYLDRRGVVLKRRLSGLPLTLSLPHSAYDGVAVRLTSSAEGDLTASVELAHRDPALTLPLAVHRSVEDAAVDWRLWCDVLRLPMLIVEADGRVMRLGPTDGVPVGLPNPRRRNATMSRRRPRFLVRRRPGLPGEMPVLTGWREIIART
jgi:hypothetical protein